MPSFDVVSEVNLQEVRNAVDQAIRELNTRFDFRQVDAGLRLENRQIEVWAEEDFQLEQLVDILFKKLTGRTVDLKALKRGDVEGSGKRRREYLTIHEGIDKESARTIARLIKQSAVKVQSTIQLNQVRVSGKKRDDLQATMRLLRESEFTVPLQFKNLRD